jgi:hypothetical protein
MRRRTCAPMRQSGGAGHTEKCEICRAPPPKLPVITWFTSLAVIQHVARHVRLQVRLRVAVSSAAGAIEIVEWSLSK